MAKKSKKFYVLDKNEEPRKVNPDKKRFDGTNGKHRLEQDTVVNGHLFVAGLYPFDFWNREIVDKQGNKLAEQEQVSAPAEVVVDNDVAEPEPSPSQADVSGASSSDSSLSSDSSSGGAGSD